MNRKGSWFLLVGAGIGTWALTRLLRRRRLRSRAGCFQDRIVVITGASRGIGRALAHAFAVRGASLVLAARSEDQLRAVASECEAMNLDVETLVIPTDVTDEAQLENLIRTTLDHFVCIDILVNNAGIVQGGSFVEIGIESIRQSIEVNLVAAMRLTQLVLPAMIEQGSGHIVNISSVMGRHAIPYMLSYSTSKHGLVGFGEGLRRELDGTGVHVLTANIGFADTDMVSEESRQLLRPFGVRVQPPEGIALRVLNAMALGQPEITIGSTEHLAEWISRFSLKLADRMWRDLAPPEWAEISARQRTE